MSRKIRKTVKVEEEAEKINIVELGDMMRIPEVLVRGIIRREKLDPNYKLTIIQMEKLRKKHYGGE